MVHTKQNSTSSDTEKTLGRHLDFTPGEEKLLTAVMEASARFSTPVYLIGGAVRDLLLKEKSAFKDLDFTVEGDPGQIARAIQEHWGGNVALHDRFLTAKLSISALDRGDHEGDLVVDFAAMRSEIYKKPGSLPDVSPTTLEFDLARRDFSINALALPVDALVEWLHGAALETNHMESSIIDQFQGKEDLQQRVVRILHNESFSDDPTRILRGCRYATRIRGFFNETTVTCLTDALGAGALQSISTMRILNEFRRAWQEPDPVDVFRLMGSLGVLTHFPGLSRQGVQDFLESLERLDSIHSVRRTAVGYEVLVRLLDLFREEGSAPLLGSSRQPGPVGWKKKRLGSMEREQQKGSELEFQTLPDDSLLFWWTIDRNSAACFSEMEKRGFVQGPG